jgi:hypothetical protein
MSLTRRLLWNAGLTRVASSVLLGSVLSWLSAAAVFIVPTAPMTWDKSIASNDTRDLVWQYLHDQSPGRDTVVSWHSSGIPAIKRQQPPPWSTAATDPGASASVQYGFFAQIASGYPFRSFLSGHHGTQPVDAQGRVGRTLWKSAWAIPLRTSTDPQLVPPDSLPFKPIPLGFALSTLFWAIPSYLGIYTFARMRYTRRRRIGLCTRCAYPIANLTTCPECGTAVTARGP